MIKSQEYLDNNGFNSAYAEIMPNAANIMSLKNYLEDLPAQVEKEITVVRSEVTKEIEKSIEQKINVIKIGSSNPFDDTALKVAMKKLDRKISRTLASQAALANLFQPYSVGKLNLTAAVGGYKSEHAVAIGTGYRFNERFAARASVSFVRGGSATYGAGINFEY